jgi:hypothetical protein
LSILGFWGLRIRTTQTFHYKLEVNSMLTKEIRRVRLSGREYHGVTCNKLAEKAAQEAKAKGWQTWTMYDQSDVLEWATTVAQKPGTNWYIIGQWIEDDEVVYKVQGKRKDVLRQWLCYTNALEPNY